MGVSHDEPMPMELPKDNSGLLFEDREPATLFREFAAECVELAHLNAIRLLKALVAAGASRRAPMASDWVHYIAVRNMSLEGTELASAVACAERERWLADSQSREDWIYLTVAGEVVGKLP